MHTVEEPAGLDKSLPMCNTVALSLLTGEADVQERSILQTSKQAHSGEER